MQYQIQCPVTKYLIEFRIDNEVAFWDFTDCDFVYPKAFFNLIRRASIELEKKGIKLVRQSVTEDDYNAVIKDKTSWRIVNKHNHGVFEIECDINELIPNIGKSFDIH